MTIERLAVQVSKKGDVSCNTRDHSVGVAVVFMKKCMSILKAALNRIADVPGFKAPIVSLWGCTKGGKILFIC